MQEHQESKGTKQSSNKTSISECPESFAKWYCLNGATCFSVTVGESTLYNCWCPIGFHGLRCDNKYVERKHQGQLRKQSDANQNQLALVIATNSHKAKLAHRGGEQSQSINQEAMGSLKSIKQQEQQEQQPGKEIHLIIYNISVLLVLVILIALLLRLTRRGGGRRAVNDNEIPDNQAGSVERQGCPDGPAGSNHTHLHEWLPDNNGKINHQDSASIGLSLIKQWQPTRSQHKTNDDRTVAHYQMQQQQQLWEHPNYIKLLRPNEQPGEEHHHHHEQQQLPQQRHHNQQQVQCNSLIRNSRQHLRETVCLGQMKASRSSQLLSGVLCKPAERCQKL